MINDTFATKFCVGDGGNKRNLNKKYNLEERCIEMFVNFVPYIKSSLLIKRDFFNELVGNKELQINKSFEFFCYLSVHLQNISMNIISIYVLKSLSFLVGMMLVDMLYNKLFHNFGRSRSIV